MGAHLTRKPYAAPSAEWDHDHCEFCAAKFSAAPEDLHAGYATANDEHWICPTCFTDFVDVFQWTVGLETLRERRDASNYFENFSTRPNATDVVIADVQRDIGVELPPDYIEFLKLTNGGEGFIGDRYVILFPVEVLADLNKAYQVEVYVPGLLIFGSNGGGEAFGFDTRRSPWAVVQVPFIGMDWTLAKPYAATFGAFVQTLGSTPLPDEVPHGTEPAAASGMEIVEITPSILGGEPRDPANKRAVDRTTHQQLVRYWNKVIRQLREQGGSPSP